MIMPRDSKFATLSHRCLHKLVDYGNGSRFNIKKAVNGFYLALGKGRTLFGKLDYMKVD